MLAELGAIDGDGRITEEGQKLRRLPLPPRLARMVVDAAAEGAALPAAEIAVLIGERGLAGDDVDLTHRLDAFHRDRSPRAREARAMAERWAQIGEPHSEPVPTEDGGNRAPARFLRSPIPSASPKTAAAQRAHSCSPTAAARKSIAASPLAREPYLAVAELTGSAASGRILLAAPITLAEIEARFADRIVTSEDITFDPASASLRVRRLQRLGAITLSEQPLPAVASDDAARILAEGIARLGIHRLPWTNALRQWRDRVMFLRASRGRRMARFVRRGACRRPSTGWPRSSQERLRSRDISADEFAAALAARLPCPLQRRLDAEAPTHFEAPTGSRVPIDYEAEGGPKIAIRVQELFGLDRHPAIAGGKIPLLIELLSPAQRPVQLTRDLPGFWRGSYAAVRAEMRGRYPKHPWPDNPLTAPPTRRAKRRSRPIARALFDRSPFTIRSYIEAAFRGANVPQTETAA